MRMRQVFSSFEKAFEVESYDIYFVDSCNELLGDASALRLSNSIQISGVGHGGHKGFHGSDPL